jgi:hypothetical protein
MIGVTRGKALIVGEVRIGVIYSHQGADPDRRLRPVDALG